MYKRQLQYWGNAIGETADSTTNFAVDGIDQLRTRNAFTSFLDGPQPITNLFDFNRDQNVDGTDESIAALNFTNFTNQLVVLNPPASSSVSSLLAGGSNNLLFSTASAPSLGNSLSDGDSQNEQSEKSEKASKMPMVEHSEDLPKQLAQKQRKNNVDTYFESSNSKSEDSGKGDDLADPIDEFFSDFDIAF